MSTEFVQGHMARKVVETELQARQCDLRIYAFNYHIILLEMDNQQYNSHSKLMVYDHQ